MKNRLNYGEELEDLFRYGTWQLPRSSEKNKSLKISGMIISGKISNKAIGLALAKNYNVILSIESVNWNDLNSKLLDAIEILYKNDLFLFSLGFDWIFHSMAGRELLAHIVFGSPQLIGNVNINIPHLFISYQPPRQLSDLLQRFSYSFYWGNSKEITSNNLVILPQPILDCFDILIDNQVNCIISTFLSSKIVEKCIDNDIIPIWVHNHELLNEIARDLTYSYARSLRIPIEFSPMNVKKMQIDGLDGI